MKTKQKIRLLEIKKGVKVIRILHIDYDPEGRPLQLTDHLYAADQHEFAFDWTENNTNLND